MSRADAWFVGTDIGFESGGVSDVINKSIKTSRVGVAVCSTDNATFVGFLFAILMVAVFVSNIISEVVRVDWLLQMKMQYAHKS